MAAEMPSNNPMEGIERLEMIISHIHHPFAHVVRLVGRLNPAQPSSWAKPNIAFRLEVGDEDDGKRPLTRAYTVRRFDWKENLIEIDFIIHEGDAPAMHWLETVKVGTSVFVIGPRHHFIPDYNLGKKIAFFADDTAIPALYAILSQWPGGVQASVYIDCATRDYAAELPFIEGVSYHIYVRKQGEMAGKSGYLPSMASLMKPGQYGQVWVACEREEARFIRQHFVEQCNLDKKYIKAVGYWKRGMSASQLDSARLAYYAQLHEAGKENTQFEELDMPV